MIDSVEIESAASANSGQLALLEATVKESISRNVLVDGASKIGYMLSRFFVPPFVLAHVSLEAYGLWSTSFVLVSYIGVSTLGISNVYIKYIAEYAARQRYRDANSLVSTGLMITLPTCIAIFAAAWFGWPYLSSWMHVSAALAGDAREIVLSVIGVFLISVCLSPFHDILAGVQKTSTVQYIRTFCYLVETVLIFLLVAAGRGIRGLAEAYVVRNVLEVLISAPITFRRVPWLQFSHKLFSRQAVRALFGFGSIVQLQSLLAILLDSVERAIAAPLLGLEATGLLEISQKLPNMASSLPLAFSSAFLPASSYLHGGGETGDRETGEAIRKLYLKGARYMNLSTSYICGFMALLPVALFHVWMGRNYAGGAYLMVVFTLATQVHLLTGPGTTILRGIGRPKEEFYYCIPNVIALLITVPLARLIEGRWTMLGIGTAVPAATALAAAFFVRRANRLLGLPFVHYFREVVLPGLVPYAIAACLTLPVSYAVAHSSRWAGAGYVFASGLIYSLALALVVDRFVWKPGERLWFRSILWQNLSQIFRLRRPTAEVTVSPHRR
jgi:O-antigen/teichoic acid export membrane protein